MGEPRLGYCQTVSVLKNQSFSQFNRVDPPRCCVFPSSTSSLASACGLLGCLATLRTNLSRWFHGKPQQRLSRKKETPSTFYFLPSTTIHWGVGGDQRRCPEPRRPPISLGQPPPSSSFPTTWILTSSFEATNSPVRIATPLRISHRLRSPRPPLVDDIIIHGVLGFRCSHGSNSSQARGGQKQQWEPLYSDPSSLCLSSSSPLRFVSPLPTPLLRLPQLLLPLASLCRGLSLPLSSPTIALSFRPVRFWSRAPQERRQAAAGRWSPLGGTGCGGAGEDGLLPYLTLSGGIVRTLKYLFQCHRSGSRLVCEYCC